MTGKINVLIIDDEENFGKLVKLNLEKTGKFSVLTAVDGRTGIGLARRNKPDVILLDVMMPEMSGSEVAERLNDHELTSSIPIIFLTALVKQDEVEERGGYIKDHRFLAKPISSDSLVRSIESVLSIKRDRLRLEGN
jgi:CheY-like chemotaxis protein